MILEIDVRLMKEEDVPFVNLIRNGYAKKYLHDSRTFTNEESVEWFNKTKPEFYIIRYKGQEIGYFRTSNLSKENNNIYIGCDIDPSFTGKGIGYAAYKIFLEILFNEMNFHKVSLEVLSTNERAIHLYNKLGFVLEGIKREDVLKDGKYVDSKIMSILKTEFLN
jgi:RimJ/RimL family protein N-acetyltransferase